MALIFNVFFAITIGLVVAMAIDRYWAVCHPISYHNSCSFGFQKWAVFTCVLAGLLPIIIGSIPQLSWKNENITSCRIVEILSYGLLTYVSCYIFGAAFIIIILYGCIYRSVSKNVSYDECNDYKFNQ